jgi:hypothetical protein
LIYDHPINETLKGAPFPIGEWSMWVPVAYYQRVVSWYTQHRGDFSLLVHPNTGCENEDHSTWAQWTGQAWPLDMSIFTPLTQTNEFDQKPGTDENPCAFPKLAMCVALSIRCTPTPMPLCPRSPVAREWPAAAVALYADVRQAPEASKNSLF